MWTLELERYVRSCYSYVTGWLAEWIPTQDEDEDVLGLEDEIRVQNYS